MANSSRGCKIKIRHQLYRVRMYTEGLTADWEGTFWKDKKAVKESLRMATGELNRMYDELDAFTGIKNKRIML